MSDPTTSVNVLVPLDGSPIAEQAIPYARAVAGPNGTVTLLTVTPQAKPMRGPLGDLVASADEVTEIFDTESHETLDGARERWKAVVGDLQTATAIGDPKEQIVKFAVEHGYAYLAMSSRGRGAVGRLIFGSVADTVARTTLVPVVIVQPKEEEPKIEAVTISRLIVPLDGSDVARAALPAAAEIGNRLKLQAILIQAVDPNVIATAYPGTEAFYSADLYDQLVEDQENVAQTNLVEAAAELKRSGVEATWVVMDGAPIQSIEQQLKDGDLIVMTSHGRSGIRRWVMGSIAEQLIRDGPAPVLLVPAPGREKATEPET